MILVIFNLFNGKSIVEKEITDFGTVNFGTSLRMGG